jgi:hypothetical protein
MWEKYEISPMGLCESPIMGEFIRTPANTWSNLVFFLVGFWLVFKYRQSLQKYSFLKLIVFGVFAVGFCSFVYHMAYIKKFLLLDNFGMFSLSSFVISLDLKRLLDFRNAYFWFFYIFLTIFSILITLFSNFALGFIWFFILYVLAISLELFFKFKRRDISTYKYFILMLLLQCLGGIFWLIDKQKIICNPHNHWFQIHVIWHVTNAIIIFLLFKHFENYFETKEERNL